MTRKGNRELVNHIRLKNGERFYDAEQLDILADLGIECYEINWGTDAKSFSKDKT